MGRKGGRQSREIKDNNQLSSLEAMDARPQPSPTTRKGGHEVLLGKYELGRLLGRGSFAKVYYARSLSDGSGVAVKVLNKAELVNSGMAARILAEVSAMRRLSSHPNIVRLHEVLATRRRIYLVMEHAPRGDLLSLVARKGGRLPEAMARRYFQQLLSALRFCHARGVAHRDVKLQNLLLDARGDLKVSDFGLSALPDHLREPNNNDITNTSANTSLLLRTACGTPAYTAPEVVRRQGYDGTRADAWSCGVILFVLLAGRLPFDDANLPLMYQKIRKREYEFPTWFPPQARRVVVRLLDPNPDTRITIEAVMELPWFRRSFSEPILSKLESPPGFCELDVSAKASTVNAFDIISWSSGLDLSGLFDGSTKEEQRFTSMASVEKVLEKVREIGGKLGYLVERRKGGEATGMRKWGSVLLVEVVEVAAPLLLVELKVEGGNGMAGKEVRWEELKAELGDIVLDWRTNGDG